MMTIFSVFALDTGQILTVLASIAGASGAGGLVGAYITIKKFGVEKKESETNQRIGLQAVDVEQFKALFPGGLGDAVEHWREEAKELYKEVDRLREIERINYDEILVLRSELDRAKAQLVRTQKDLERANRRITHLETESGVVDERSDQRPETSS